MYTLGIPDRQKRRTLGYLKQNYIEFEEHPSNEGFFDLSFPGMDEDAFRNITMKLKQQGVTTIGADEELTEKKIMKLSDLITEDFSKNLDENDSDQIVDALKRILKTWESKIYPDDKTRWEEYYMDIEELVGDFEERSPRDADESDPYSTKSVATAVATSIAEQKLRKLIRKTIRQ